MTVEMLSLWGAEEFAAQLARDAREGLSRSPKSLPPKYFYDARGDVDPRTRRR